jgi:O-methyltransferase
LFDSFEGLPKPNPEKYPQDLNDNHHTIDWLKVSLDEVKNNFTIFSEINEENPIFVKGWFRDTMPTNKVKKISILRLDGDMYESTIDVLNYLYPKLSIGGYCIIDDFGHHGAKSAVIDYRKTHSIEDEIVLIDDTPGAYPSVYWKKTK